MSQSRRARPSCDLALLAHARHLSKFDPSDIEVAKAVDATDGNMKAAAKLAQVNADTFRQRYCSYARRLKAALGDNYHIASGKVAREISIDQRDSMGEAMGW